MLCSVTRCQVPRSLRAQLCQEALDRLRGCSGDPAPAVRRAAAAALGVLLHFDTLCDVDPAALQRTCVLAQIDGCAGAQQFPAGACKACGLSG